MAYDETTFRRNDEPSDPAAYRANTLAAAEQRRRAEMLDETGDTMADAPRRSSASDEDGRDRLGIHLGWEVVLLLAAAAIALLLYRLDPGSLKRPALDHLLISGAAIGLLTLGGGLTLRAGVPNLALGPIALAASLQYAENGDQGLVKAMVPALIIAAAGGLLVGLLVLALHVPGWAATLAAAFGVVVFDQLRVAPVAVQGNYDPTGQAFFLFGGFALLAVLGGALGMITPVRRWLGRMRPAADPARRRGGMVVLPVLGSLLLSSVFAVGAGVLMAAESAGPIVPGTGLEWSGIAIGLAMLAGTSVYGRRGGIFGTLFAVAGLTLFLDYQSRRHFDIALFAIAGCVFAGGLIISRLVETYGRPLPAADQDWNAAPTTGPNWTPDLPETWSPTTAPPRTDRWDDGPWVPPDNLAVMTSASFAELDALPTEELRERAFAAARHRLDVGFFWSVLKHLPDSEQASELDGAPNSIGPTIEEATALWREFEGHGYGEQEPLLRAAFIDYLQKH